MTAAALDRSALYELVVTCIRDELEIDLRFVTMSEDISFKAIGFDSLDAVELCCVLEQELGMTLELTDVEYVVTVGQLIDLLEAKQGAPQT